MEFSLLTFWGNQITLGFELLAFDFDKEDGTIYSLIGFSYDKEYKLLEVDILYACFEFKR